MKREDECHRLCTEADLFATDVRKLVGMAVIEVFVSEKAKRTSSIA